VHRIRTWLDRLYLKLDQGLRGWLTLLVRIGLAFGEDDGAVVSRSIAYYALFSVFPLFLAVLTLASSFVAVEGLEAEIVAWIERYLPIVADLVQVNIQQVLAARNTVGILALASLVWSASGVFTAMYRAVNRAWDNPKSKLFWREKFFGLSVVFIVGFLLLSTTLLSTVASILQSWQASLFGWQPLAEPRTARLVGWLSTFLPVFVAVLTFIVLYRIIPQNPVTWKDVWLGGLVAGLTWEAARRLFTWYLANFARYSLIYGSVGAIIGFLLWAYISAMILLLGAEFTAQLTTWRRAGRPIEPRPLSQWIGEWSK
jgi:membrane protein